MLNLLLASENELLSTIVIILLIVAMIGLFIWSSYSNKKKQKQAQDMVIGIQIGDKVKTIGGVCGYVAEINDAENTFVLKTGMEGQENSFNILISRRFKNTAPNRMPMIFVCALNLYSIEFICYNIGKRST